MTSITRLAVPTPALRARSLIAQTTLFGAAYGAVMGSFHLTSLDRAMLMVYGAAKVPLLIFVTSLICLPAYFTLNTVLRLRPDFPAAARAVLSAQSSLTLALASLAPLTRFIYWCGVDHRWALLTNAMMFTLATAAAQVVLIRRYRPLITRNPRHRIMLAAWVVMYAFVGTQCGWMLRPFVGTPSMPVTFLRDEPFSNAYVVVARLILGAW